VPAVSQLEVQTDVNIIEFTEEEQATIMEAFPVSEFMIAADTYETLEADARSVSMWNFAIANCDLPESFVYAVVDVVMSDNERMVNIHRAAALHPARELGQERRPDVAPRCGPLVRGKRRRGHPRRHDPLAM
jgi:TRAP-type uncharacterized transport system substrate-binding protein